MQEVETLEPGITTVEDAPVIETAPPEIKHLFVPQRLEGESFDEYQSCVGVFTRNFLWLRSSISLLLTCKT